MCYVWIKIIKCWISFNNTILSFSLSYSKFWLPQACFFFSLRANRIPILGLETVCLITTGERNLSKVRCKNKQTNKQTTHKNLSTFPSAIGKQTLVCIKSPSLQMLFLTEEFYVTPWLQRWLQYSMVNSFSLFIYWSIVDLQRCVNFCCTAKWKGERERDHKVNATDVA